VIRFDLLVWTLCFKLKQTWIDDYRAGIETYMDKFFYTGCFDQDCLDRVT
jgi:hypothetical protein